MRSRSQVFRVAALLAAGASAILPLAGATSTTDATSSAHVAIARCRPFLRMNAVQITFRVEGARTADEVVFAVSLGSLSQTLADVGRFSPGITIDRFFAAQDALTHAFAPLTCAVESVRYVDEDAS
jgi:hypothetical protein